MCILDSIKIDITHCVVHTLRLLSLIKSTPLITTMPSSPKLKYDDLIDRLNDIVRDGSANDFELRRIESEVFSLAKTDAHSSFILRGILACFRNDIEGARRFHKKSLLLRDDAMTKLQYASSLCNLGQFLEAIKIFEGIYKTEKDNLTLIEHFIDATISSFKYRRALSLLNDWKKLKPNEQHRDDQLVRNVVNLMDELHITDEDVMYVQTAYSSVVEEGCKIRGRKIMIREEEGFKWLDVEYLVPTTVDDILEKNYAFAKEITGIATSNILERLVFRFSVYSYAN